MKMQKMKTDCPSSTQEAAHDTTQWKPVLSVVLFHTVATAAEMEQLLETFPFLASRHAGCVDEGCTMYSPVQLVEIPRTFAVFLPVLLINAE